MAQDILSKSECYEVVCNALKIHQSKSISVEDFTLVPLNEDVVGFMGEYFRLIVTVTIDNAKPQKLSFFIKSVPITNILQRKEVEERGVFKKEIFLYSKLFKDIEPFVSNKWHADCFYTRDDILVLEDLGALEYEHINEDFSVHHLEAGFKCIAAMHATSLAYEAKSGLRFNNFSNELFEPQVTLENSWFQAGLLGIKAVALAHPKFQTEKHQNFISEKMISYFYCIYEMVNPSKEFRNVLCHRDAWSQNVFFKRNHSKKSSECILVDFQLARYHPPIIDVYFFLYSNTNRSTRKEIFEWCLKCYYQSLQESLKEQNLLVEDIIEWDELKRSCDAFKLLPLVLYAMDTPLTHIPKSYLNNIKLQDPARYDYYMTINRDDMILEMMEKNSHYKERVRESVQELVDYVFEKID